jgi:hypothetical protein
MNHDEIFKMDLVQISGSKVQGPVVQRNFVTILALNYLGVKSTGLN